MTGAPKALTLQKYAIYGLAIIVILAGAAVAAWGVLFTVLIGPFSLVISIPGLLIAFFAPNIIKTLDQAPNPNPVGRFFIELLASLSLGAVAFFAFNMLDSAAVPMLTSLVTPVWVVPTLIFILSLIRTFRTASHIKERP